VGRTVSRPSVGLEQSDVKVFENPSWRSRLVLFALVAAVGAVLVWTSGFLGHADGQAPRNDKVAAATPDQGAAKAADTTVDLSEKQAASLRIGPIATHEFAIQKNAVGTIDFNENMLVQVFSQYPGKIIKAFYNVGDDVKRGDILFT